MKPKIVPLHLLLALGVGLGLAAPGSAQTPEFERIPEDAVGFIHIRAADLWRLDAFKNFREVLEKAGPKALGVLEQRFVPSPSSLDRVTLIVMFPSGQAPTVAAIVRTTTEFNPLQLVQRNLPHAKSVQAGGLTVYADASSRIALAAFDKQTFVVGDISGVQLLAAAQPQGGAGPLSTAFELAKQKPIVVALQPNRLKALMQGAAPPPIAPLLEAQTLVAALDLGTKSTFNLQLDFASREQATAGEQALRNGLKFMEAALTQGRGQIEGQLFGPQKAQSASWQDLPETLGAVFGLGMMNQVQDALRTLPLKREGNVVRTTLEFSTGDASGTVMFASVAAGMLLPAVQKVREAASRAQGMNNLKQMALAMHNFHAAFGHLPAAAITDKAGKPLLSWRVAILPFVEQETLYREFKLDQPWDSPHNIQLLKKMPKIYQRVGVSRDGDTETYYRVFTGPQAPFDLRKRRRFADFTDGTSNTMLIVEAAQPVPWTKPDELVYDPQKPVPALARFSPAGTIVCLADGSVRTLPPTVDEGLLRALITHAGGEVVQFP